MKPVYITIVGFNKYYEIKPFSIGSMLTCEKERTNVYDSEAIRVQMPPIGTVGYVANSVHTKANGTCSAGRIYEMVGDIFLAQVLFTTSTKVIARIIRFDVKQGDLLGCCDMEDEELGTGMPESEDV